MITCGSNFCSRKTRLGEESERLIPVEKNSIHYIFVVDRNVVNVVVIVINFVTVVIAISIITTVVIVASSALMLLSRRTHCE